MTTSVAVLDANGAVQTINTLPALGQAIAAASLPVTLASDQGAFQVSGAFYQAIQPVSGTVTVSGSPIQATGGTVGLVAGIAAIGSVTVTGTSVVSGTVTANAGTNLNTSLLALDSTLTGGTQQTKITDGTRVATIKAASTAAVATDTAIVVALSPNNAIATTTTALASTSSPSYANATNNSLSANLAGALRVDGSAVTQPISGAVTVSGSVATTGTYFQTTQPVSIASSVAVTGTFFQTTQPISGAVSITGSPTITVGNASLAVTGSFFQTTQPVSGTVTVGNASLAVTGGFYQATQPVSLAASVAVTGTFFQVTQPVSIASMPSTPVTGTFWQATQPISGTVTVSGSPIQATGGTVGLVAGVAAIGSVSVTGTTAISAASLPLPSGAMTATGGTVGLVAGAAAIGTVGVTGSVAITAAALPLPTLAATSTKQPALGTAGTASVDVLTIQGVASMTPLKVDGSAVTQPVSGAFYQATQPVSIAASVAVTGAFYQTTQPVSIASALAVTGTFFQTTQPISIASMPSTPVTGTFWQGTQPVSGVVTANLGTGVPDTASTGNTLNSATLNTAYTLTIANGQSTSAFSVVGLTASGATLAIEVSDDSGATWFAANGLASASGVLFTTLTVDQQFRVGAAGRTRVRLRVSVVGVGTVTIASNLSVGVGLMAVSAPLPPGSNVIGGVTQSGTWNIGTITTLPALPANQSVNVAQMAGVATSMGAGVADTGTQRVVLSNEAAADLNITGQAVQTAAGQNIMLAVAGVGATDCTGYRAISIQIIPAGTVSSGVVSFEGSNDNVTFTAISLQDEAAPAADPVSTVSPLTGVNRYMTGPVRWRYFRARISTLIGGGGSLSAVTRLTQVSFSDDQISVTQTTASLLNGTMVLAGGTASVGSFSMVGRNNSGGTPGRITTGASGFIKASSGQFYGWNLTNVNAAVRFLQLYAKATAGVPGTDTPIYTIPFGASGRSDFEISIGIASATGLAWAITTDAAGITAGASGDIVGSVVYN